MKTVIKVTNSKKSFYHGIVGTNIYASMDDALDAIIELKNKTGCVSYKGKCKFSVKYLEDVKDEIEVIKGISVI
jgi:hypothetical protein